MAINQFLVLGAEGGPEIPRSLYAYVDQMEQTERERLEVRVLFDCVGASWFDECRRQDFGDDRFFTHMPLSAVELITQDRSLVRLLNDVRAARKWLMLELADGQEEPQVVQYPTLFAPGVRRRLESFGPAPPFAAQRLTKELSLDDVSDAPLSTIRSCLGRVEGVDCLVVYDVGQGNANGICDEAGMPRAYFDLGGGVTGHTHTFPTAFTDVCVTHNPPVVLSHWDWDHWSSGSRFWKTLQLDWIVPRQTMGAVQRAFAWSIQSAGRLLVWPQGASRLRTGRLIVERCTGAGRNHSGLAVLLERGHPSQAMLLPGDTRYSAIPSGKRSDFTAIVAPHHGGNMRNKYAPPCLQASHNRLVYSYGAGDHYGHPHRLTRAHHEREGWRHGGPGRVLMRCTADRSASGLGHVAVHWELRHGAMPLPCGGACSLEVQQF